MTLSVALTMLCLLVLILLVVPSAIADDEIIDLPGLSFDLNFKHYSGYLQASKTRFLHYW